MGRWKDGDLWGLCLPWPCSCGATWTTTVVTWRATPPPKPGGCQVGVRFRGQCHIHPVLNQGGGFVYAAVCSREESAATQEGRAWIEKPEHPKAHPASSAHELCGLDKSHSLPRALVSPAVKREAYLLTYLHSTVVSIRKDYS